MHSTSIQTFSVDEWLEEHPKLKAFLTESAGKAISGAIWLKDLLSKDKRAKIITMAAGIAVDYGYDRLMAYADIEEAKASFSAYLEEKDTDLNKEQADILAGAAIKFAKEAGRVLTHKYASKGVNVLKDKLKGPEQQPLVFYKEYTSGKKENNIIKVSEDIKKWIGEGGKRMINKNDDLVLVSKNGNRRVRFDLNNPYPHSNPHTHVEELVDGKWVKATHCGVPQLYPNDVTKH